MTAKAVAWAWRQALGEPLRKLVLLLIADEANALGEATIETFDFADLCGCSEADVQRCLWDMARLGVLLIKHEGGENTLWGVELNLEIERPTWGGDR